jgi:CYTH domain-containing protein
VIRRAGEGRYAHVEREQRWIASGVPPGAERWAEIVDRYIPGTRLRLRHTETGEQTVFKLGQKVRLDPDDPETVKLTNIYLCSEEFAVLASLPAAELRKTRWRLAWAGKTVAVDQFHGRLDGLVLAEVELAPGDHRLGLPPFAVHDVTNDDRYSGGALASASDESVEEVLGHSPQTRSDGQLG